MRTVFEQARATAIADLAKLLVQIQDRVGFPTAIPILGYGMRMIDNAETAQNLKEWEGHLTKLHEFFQTNLNNRFHCIRTSGRSGCRLHFKDLQDR